MAKSSQLTVLFSSSYRSAGSPVPVSSHHSANLAKCSKSTKHKGPVGTTEQKTFDANETTWYYYNNNWQVLAETDANGATQRWFVYGNYIDEPLMMVAKCLDNTDPSNFFAHILYYVQDALYSTRALVAASQVWVIEEQTAYDVYGSPLTWTSGDADADRIINLNDLALFKASIGESECDPNYNWRCDLDNSEVVNLDDLGGFTRYSSTPANQQSFFTNPYYFTGRRVDLLDDGNLQLQHNRHRHYDYYTGRWLTQDPAGYIDGMNLYEYVGSASLIRTDPLGKFSPSLHGPITQDGYDDSGVTFRYKYDMLRVVKRWNTKTDYDLLGDAYHCTNVSFVNKVKDHMGKIKTRDCQESLRLAGAILEWTGRVLHILQDCMSHTDWCEGGNIDMQDLYFAVFNKITNDRYDFDSVSNAAASEALIYYAGSSGNTPYYGISIDLSLLEVGSSAEVSGRMYYPNIGASGSHGLYAADYEGHGRTKWKKGSPDPYVHLAWEHAHDTAVLQTSEFFKWVEENVTFCCRCALFIE